MQYISRAHTMHWQMLSPVITYPSPRSRQRCHTAPLCPITLRTADAQLARLDFSSLDSAVQQLFSTGLANSMKKSYQSSANRYIRFCSLFGVTPYPTTERSLSHFVGFFFFFFFFYIMKFFMLKKDKGYINSSAC